MTGVNGADSLIEILPKIVAQGKKEAQRILDGLSKTSRITLQTNELVLPAKAKGGLFDFTGQSVKSMGKKDWLNRMIYGNNLLAMQALLAGDPETGNEAREKKKRKREAAANGSDNNVPVVQPRGQLERKPEVLPPELQ